ncbi:hypothetical protein IB252_16170 [Pseudomonas sp. PDM10]|uniref:hypothetical protein n=1 Tax=Pseudomonas sp. PDM10 TaxID=2769269 RepID=UPI00177E8764|nr:hypothetical protein [Pseudomonas sp. PDM10]MBD9601352.1 hypothetical protein [Pseudomonas sp. PDM10]
MPLGHWGKNLKRKNFSEVTYLGVYSLLMFWCMKNDNYSFDSVETKADFAALKDPERKLLETEYLAQTMGNCGALANYFLEYGEKLASVKTSLKHITDTFESNPCGVFRVSVGQSHTFIGIKSTDPSCPIELLQAWENEYTIDDWLSRNDNVFAVPEFLELLENLSDVATYKAASDRLFKTKNKGGVTHQVKITSFAFKKFETVEALNGFFTLETTPPDHVALKAGKYEWDA